jgi:class 3 adenylate cyclase
MESSSRTLVCSVLFLDIVEYSKKAVADQLHFKQSFNQVLSKALDQVAPRDRIILDTGDGAAVTFMGDPEDALFAAMSVRDMAARLPQALPVRLGVNLGPVRLVKDLNGQMNIIGDGINVAQRVMGFSRPGQLLVSRSFYEVVSCLSRDYLTLFQHEGSRTDKHVREHEVYSVVGGAPGGRRVAEATPPAGILPALRNWLARSGPLGFRNSALVAGPAAFLLIVGTGAAIGERPGSPPVAAVASGTAQPQVAEQEAPAKPGDVAAEKPRRPTRKALAKQEPEPRAEKPSEPQAEKAPASALALGRLEVAATPWGTVYVDGKKLGTSPPLLALDLAAGSHTIVIHNAAFSPYVSRVTLKPGEAQKITHRFKK